MNCNRAGPISCGAYGAITGLASASCHADFTACARLRQTPLVEHQRRGCIETAHPAPRNTQADEEFLGRLLAGFRR
jgi:hypothetical protein